MRQIPDREPLLHEETHLRCEECQMPLWRAGEVVPAGTYTRVDDKSYRTVMLDQEGPLPATFDGHVALYCTAACACRDRANRKLVSSNTHERHQPAEQERNGI